ncbi:MAG: sugar phosphate isomerase/epimerase family protein [candidate division NC10 bacterium]|nr:sugar phosphate isomerase/epimerase family protein [candidate division NC10 bacterium]
MKEFLQSYMRVGIVHFMAFPETMKGEGPILETVKRIAEDNFFSAIEITSIKESAVREKVAKLLKDSRMTVGFGGQPVLLMAKLDLNSLEEEKRRAAVDRIRSCVDEAASVGAQAVAVLSGPDPGPAHREQGLAQLIRSLKEICEYARGHGDPAVILETFDAEIDKCCLIGPSSDALRVAKEVKASFPKFGLMVDLSHLPLQRETPQQALGILKDYLAHVHIGNCVMKDKSHPAYGDLHPAFGCPGGEVDVPQLTSFLKALFEVGYLGEGRRPVVAFEVKPMPGESSEAVISGAKRTLLEAWARL